MMIDWVDLRLIEWGDYMKDSNGLGYPSSSIEHRMQQGCFGGGSVQVSDGYIPSAIEKTETAVLTLPHDLQAVVNVAYMTPPGRELQAKRVSNRLGRRVSRDRLNKMLDQSHTRLAGVFDGMKIKRDW